MYPIAIGVLGLTGDEFEALTPRELYWRMQGYRRHRALDRRQIAELAVWVMNPWLTQTITVDDLVGPLPSADPFAWDDE